MNKKSQQSDPIYVGVDDGFAATKIFVLDGDKKHQLVIPSRARAGIHGITAISEEEGYVAPGYETDGMKFTVVDSVDSESARFNEYPFSPLNRVIIAHALRLAGLAGREIKLATGLPISMYYRGGKVNTDNVVRKTESLETEVKSMDEMGTAIIAEHKVFPEGLAAWIDYAVDEQGELRADMNETVGVIDIGGRTTDIAVILPGKRIDHARSGSADAGVLDVIEAVRLELTHQHGVDIPVASIEKALRTNKITMWGKPVDISDVIQRAADDVLGKIHREINRRIGSGVDLDRVILVGGGAHVFKSAEQQFPNLIIPDEPEYANARGFVKYMAL